jgi:hypothetical protein
MSEIPSSFLSRTISAAVSIHRALFIMNGSSVTMIACRSLRISSSCATPRTAIVPRPVLYADRMPSRPWITPPVGKSGPGMIRTSSSSVISASAIIASTPSISSPRLCGGMLVAMPTAMPCAPLSKRFGTFVGRTVGSSSLSS